MRKRLAVLLTLLAVFTPALAFVPSPAYATDIFQVCNKGAGATDICKSKNSASKQGPFLDVMGVVLRLLALAVGFAAIVMLIMNSLKMIWAQGDPAGVKSAREGIIGALVGLAVAAVAQGVVVFILNKIK